MTAIDHSTAKVTWVAIDIAKKWNVVLVEDSTGRRQKFKVANSHTDHNKLVNYLQRQGNSHGANGHLSPASGFPFDNRRV
jgi:DhnA family fructose-bisphosphate aldolase class Ia